MRKGFLEIIKKERGSGNYAGDEFGGGRGTDGSGIPTSKPGNFMFATGIECSYPTIDNGKTRRDLLAECRHYECLAEDLNLIKDLGLKVVRYGLPYYLISRRQGRYDWEFADRAMKLIQKLELTPILDLMHFGVPDWIGNYQNPELPVHFANYCAAVAKRYPWVRYYTPINEIYVTAKFSAKDGIWNEQLKSDQAFVTAMKHLVAASIMGTQEIVKRRNDAIIVQSESAEYIHETCAAVSQETKMTNKQRLISLDLLYAHPPDADICHYLMDNGLTREEYDWFMVGEPPGYQVMGNDYYGNNERIKLPDNSQLIAEDVFGWYQITKEYYQRYKKSVMHTETNTFDREKAPTWLWKQWINVLQMRADGVPVLGFTWYSLIDQIDWNIGLAEKKGTINECGLYDLNRQPRPVAEAYRMLLKEYGQITIVPHGEMFEVTNEAARLKVEV